MIILFTGVKDTTELKEWFPNCVVPVEATNIDIQRVLDSGETVIRTMPRVVTCVTTLDDLVDLQDQLGTKVDRAGRFIRLTETHEPVEYIVDILSTLGK